jgi:hypothetical protein
MRMRKDPNAPLRARVLTRRQAGLVAGRAVFAGVAAALPVVARADEAPALMKAVNERPNGRDMSSVSRMELVERGRAPRVRELITYRYERGRGEVANLMRFVEPKDIAGTGLLSLDKADGTNDQWLYLPGLDRVRRIAGDRKGGRFVGSELYYEDLRERAPAMDRHRTLGREAVAGVDCVVVESVPVDAAESVYRKRVSWVEPATALVHRLDYFERDDTTPTKRWLLGARRKVQSYWTVTDSRVTDLGNGNETRLLVETVLYDRRLPAKLFTPQALADEGLESEYRP